MLIWIGLHEFPCCIVLFSWVLGICQETAWQACMCWHISVNSVLCGCVWVAWRQVQPARRCRLYDVVLTSFREFCGVLLFPSEQYVYWIVVSDDMLGIMCLWLYMVGWTWGIPNRMGNFINCWIRKWRGFGNLEMR